MLNDSCRDCDHYQSACRKTDDGLCGLTSEYVTDIDECPLDKELINQFEEPGKSDVSKAGGKGADLGELVKAGVPVPLGFIEHE